AAVARLPRIALAHLPTPLEDAPRFSARLEGPRVLLKRDDCTGMLMGGNKTRHNEFLLAEALRRGADVLVWGAGVQSNNCRQTAAACNKRGLECHLYLTRAAHDDDVQGNLLLDHLMGATIHIADTPLGPELDDLLLARAEAANRASGLVGLPTRLTATDIDVREAYIGPRYGAVRPAGRGAMGLLARTEGGLLDPAYTAKAMAGLIDDKRAGRLGAKDR